MAEIKPGLVFAVPLKEGAFGFGQIIAGKKTIFYMAALDVLKPHPELSEDELINCNLVALGFFFDALIKNKRWLAVGELPPRSVPFPCFKLRKGDSFHIENWDGTRSREATQEELNALNFRANMGPIIVEIALKKHFGIPTGHEDNNDLISQQLERVNPRYIELISDIL